MFLYFTVTLYLLDPFLIGRSHRPAVGGDSSRSEGPEPAQPRRIRGPSLTLPRRGPPAMTVAVH